MPLHETDTLAEAEIKHKMSEQIETESQVIVHCTVKRYRTSSARIWPTTFLFDKHSDHKSKLLHVENISMYPTWTLLDYSKSNHFTLIFEGLPKSCILFDLREVIPEPGAFVCHNIPRNHSDVYHVYI